MVKINIEKISNGYIVTTDFGFLTTQSGDCIDDIKEYAGNVDAIRDCLARVGIKLQNLDWSDDDSY